MAQFSNVGVGKKVKAAGEVPEDAAAEEGKEEDAESIAEGELEAGQVSAKEYDYLLGMAIWALTEERVEQLIREMNEKKMEYDALVAKHIFTLWTEDLDAFETELAAVWAKEEADRQRHGAVKNGAGPNEPPPATLRDANLGTAGSCGASRASRPGARSWARWRSRTARSSACPATTSDTWPRG